MKITVESGGESTVRTVSDGAMFTSVVSAGYATALSQTRTTLNGRPLESEQTQLRDGDIIAQFPKSGKQGGH